MEDAKQAILPAAQAEQRRAFPAGMLRLSLGFLLLAVGAGLSAFGLFLARHSEVVAAAAPALFRPCVAAAAPEEEDALERWIRPPAHARHAMTDEELLWLASSAPRARGQGKGGYPFRRVPKMAFMFLAHGPLPMAPLWERFFRGNEGRYSIYVHTMPLYRANFTSDSVFYRRQIPSKVVQWGQITMCDAERRLLANALLDISNEWFVLVSESCIPLFDFNTTYQYFQNSSQSFVMSFDDPGKDGRGRYNLNMAPEVQLEQWRKGWQWFEVDRELAIAIVRDTFYYPKFKQFCRPGCYADEHYIQTMLTIEFTHRLANRTVTWVDWSRGGPYAAHPATFGRGDITGEFLRGIRGGEACMYNDQNSTMCHLFARKFAPSALEPLLELAPTVLGFG
ncbi:unnamed protein product [Urochloa decumbens]|uniref:Core-2/I-branching beta-16-N-acetylglucosaminyltransferase family protein n=1 Tax=Urochloa decumbens TaxID=240449 RepID=A0ABC8X0D4_9POAL